MARSVSVLTGAIAAFTAIAPLAALDADRDFSGKWILDPQSSRLQALTPQPDPRLAIAQQEMAIRCEPAGGEGPALPWSFSADGAENRYSLGSERRNTVAKWEGSALLVNTIVSADRDYTIMERWKLSADRSLLTIERQVVRSGGQAEGLLVYRREGQTALANRSPATERPSEIPPAPCKGQQACATAAPAAPEFEVRAGTRIPLSLLSRIDTKHSNEGDHVYLETAFPVFSGGRLVVPRGSYVNGTITSSKQAGRVKGKSELFIRFDSLTLPNGVTRDFRSRVGSTDAQSAGRVDPTEGAITGDGNKAGDARTVGRTAGMGVGLGSIVGGAAGHMGAGLGIGSVAGAAAGLARVIGSRGPDVVLPKGTTMEMVLDRDLRYTAEEIKF